MRIDLFCLGLIQGHEPIEYVVASGGIIGSSYLPVRGAVLRGIGHEIVTKKMGAATFIIREVILHWAHRQFLLESINLIQEKDDAGLDEPPRVADAVEKSERLLHSVHRFILEK